MTIKNYLKFTNALCDLNSIPTVHKWETDKKIRDILKQIVTNKTASPNLTQIASVGLNLLELIASNKIINQKKSIDEWYKNSQFETILESIEGDSNSTQDCIEFASSGKNYLKLKQELEQGLINLSSLPQIFKRNNNEFIINNLLKIAFDPFSNPSELYKSVLGATCVINPLIKVRGIKLYTSESHADQIKDFEIGSTTVTLEEYRGVLNWAIVNGFDMATGQAQSFEHPITGINWYDAVKWCNAKSVMEGLEPIYCIKDCSGYYIRGECAENAPPNIDIKTEANGYRLPTLEEWQWAARGGRNSKGYIFAGSNNLNDVGWYSDNANGVAHAVGDKAPNELGLYDMSGNVLEWCWNLVGTSRRVCGGAWKYSADICAISKKLGCCHPNERGDPVGFRLVRSS
jgi:hypothetical protein